jgi:hypothetical protein
MTTKDVIAPIGHNNGPALDLRDDGDDGSLAGDLLVGAPAIARFIGRNLRQTYHLLEGKRLPAGKEGLIWIGSKRVLRAYYAKNTPGRILMGATPSSRVCPVVSCDQIQTLLTIQHHRPCPVGHASLRCRFRTALAGLPAINLSLSSTARFNAALRIVQIRRPVLPCNLQRSTVSRNSGASRVSWRS